MLSFDIQFTGIEEAVSKLQNYKELLQDLQPEYEIIGSWWLDFEEVNVFESEGDALDVSWPPLSPVYLAQKNKVYPGRGILEASGTLRYSFEKITSSEMLILLNRTPYGVYLNYGTSKMPPRVFMKLGQEQINIMRDMIITSLNERSKDI